MIRHNHQVLIESGNGSVESYVAISEDGVGMVCINECEPGPIGHRRSTEVAAAPNDSAIIWAFKNIESLDVSIKVFNELRELMLKYQNGELDFEEAH
jgi:hypothetical protein